MKHFEIKMGKWQYNLLFQITNLLNFLNNNLCFQMMFEYNFKAFTLNFFSKTQVVSCKMSYFTNLFTCKCLRISLKHLIITIDIDW